MRIVAVDTTTAAGSVALLEEGLLRSEVRMVAADSHSRWLVRAVDMVVEGAGLRPGEVEGWAVATGPGSFTGLRVGLSTVQGLALASGRPCVGLSSLAALAHLALGSAATVVPLLDAFRDEVYWAVYGADGQAVGGCRVGPVEAALEGLSGPVAFVGNGAARFRERIESRIPAACFPAHEPFLAATLARLAAPKLATGEGVPPESLRPLYLRAADIGKAAP